MADCISRHNCAFARCLGTGEQLLGNLVADFTEDGCNETSIPWQLHARPCSPVPSVSLFFILCFLSTHDLLLPFQRLIHPDDLYLSISFTPTQRRCAVERCIDCLTEEPEHSLTRNNKGATPQDTTFYMSHFIRVALWYTFTYGTAFSGLRIFQYMSIL